MVLGFIDATQFNTFQRCPWLWYERYVAKWGPPPIQGQRSDPIAIGSLFHAAIQEYIARRNPIIPPSVISEIGPSAEALTMAREMVQAYVTAFPIGSEGWEVQAVEKPVGKRIVAKVDALVKVEREMQVPDGIGSTITVWPGVWVLEHKTTSDRTPPAAFMRRWMMEKQADFQIFACTEEFGAPPSGIIINVVTRPSPRLSYRTCRRCNTSTPVEVIDWASPRCSGCGAPQKWNPPAPLNPPNVWRFVVVRSPEQLRTARRHIEAVAAQMEQMIADGRGAVVPNYRSCVDTWWTSCPYLDLHAYGHDPNLVQIEPFSYIVNENGGSE